MKLAVALTVLAVATAGTVTPALAQSGLTRVTCDPADNERRVAGGKECLVVRTYRPEGTVTDPVLVVFIHGDGSRGGPSDYLYRNAREAASAGRIGVAVIRPGYDDDRGNQSTGENYGREDSYTKDNIDAVAAAIKTLREHHEARRVVLVGHSGGAAYAGVILGRHPGVVDGAVLAACPCDVRVWRADRGRRPWLSSLSPGDHVKQIPPTAKVVAITGARDDNTMPRLARAYVKDLTERGIAAQFLDVAGAGHDEVMRSPELKVAIDELVAPLAKQE